MSRMPIHLVVSRMVFAAAVCSAAAAWAQAAEPRPRRVEPALPQSTRTAVPRPVAGRPGPSAPEPAVQKGAARVEGTRAEQRTDSARRGDGRRDAPRTSTVPPLDNGRSRSPFLRSLDPGTPNLTPRPGEAGADLFRAQPDTYGPRSPKPGRGRGGPRGSNGVYVYGGLPYVGWPAGAVVATTPPAAAASDAPAEGFLRLRVSPRSANVFIDGGYAGTVDDFGGVSERMLSAGTHRIELRAPGFEPVDFDARVPANDTLTFRRDMRPLDDRPAAPAPAPAPVPPPPHKTMYVLPGCYAGDAPPVASQLPARCNLADLRIIP